MGNFGVEWSEEEVKVLRELYPLTKTKEMVNYLPNRTTKSISNMANILGIKKQNSKERVKWNYELVKEYVSSQGCTLLDTSYKRNKDPLNYICVCGEKTVSTLNHFLRDVRCQVCAGNKEYTYEEVNDYFLSQECELLSDEYINNNTNLTYKCKCGNISATTFDAFKNRNVRCKFCKGESIREQRKHPYEYVFNYFKQKNCELLSKEYNNSAELLEYVCECGNKSEVRFNDFQDGTRCQDCRIKTMKEKLSGENHYAWNPEMTAEERETKRNYPEYRKWVRDVYKRDNYTCQCCKQHGGKLVAHHKDGYHWCKERRVDIDNGVTLCEKCHENFHQQYNSKHNTEEQYNDFINQYKTQEAI